jgi:hypothetical protein
MTITLSPTAREPDLAAFRAAFSQLPTHPTTHPRPTTSPYHGPKHTPPQQHSKTQTLPPLIGKRA